MRVQLRVIVSRLKRRIDRILIPEAANLAFSVCSIYYYYSTNRPLQSYYFIYRRTTNIFERNVNRVVQIIEKSFRFTSEGEMQYRDNGRVVTVTDEQSDERTSIAQHVSAVVSLCIRKGDEENFN